jgi:ribosome-associated toxin RatA of RatAB toxin-antitoxin module
MKSNNNSHKNEIYISYFAITLFSLIYTSYACADVDYNRWKPEIKKDGITVSSRSVSNAKFKELRGTITVNTKLESLIELVNDIQACPKWIHNCVEGKILQTINSPIERINYTVITAGVLSDRDLVVRSKISLSKATHIVYIKLKGEEKLVPKINRRVRIKDFRGHWKFIPIKGYSKSNGGKVYIEYQVLYDPDSNFISNNYLINNLFYTLKKISKIINNDKYKNTSIGENFMQKITIP